MRRQDGRMVSVLAAALALTVGLLHASSAFTGGVAPALSSAREGTAQLGAGVQDARVAGATPQMRSAVQSSSSSWQLASCAMLLLVSAGRMLQAKNAQRSKGIRFHVATQAFPATAPFAASKPPLVHVDAVLPKVVHTELIEVNTSSEPAVTAVPAATVFNMSTPVLAATAEDAAFAGTSASAAPRRPRAARRVSGARQQSSRRSRSAMGAGEKAAHRATGAKLQERVQVSSVPASYDASRVRTKIQMGLRYKASARGTSGRESSTPSASLGIEENSRNYLMNIVNTFLSRRRCVKIHSP